MNKVLILLSTFNGERYLAEQLQSLYAQEGCDIHILVRDDGSTDNTLSILKEYNKTHGKMTILREDNVGVARSFYRLMRYAYSEMGAYDLYAFCDQDDVWFSNKLTMAARHIDADSIHPHLYYAQAVPTDSSLKPLFSAIAPLVNHLGANIASSHSLGCTQVFNRSLLARTVKIYDYTQDFPPSAYCPLHDEWTALVAHAIGKVATDDTPVMYYRQHDLNVIGARPSGFSKWRDRVRRYARGERRNSKKCRLLLALLSYDIPPSRRILIERCALADRSLYHRLKLMFTPEMYQYGMSMNMGIFLVILFNKF